MNIIDRLKSVVSEWAMLHAVPFNILADTQSDHLLEVSRDIIVSLLNRGEHLGIAVWNTFLYVLFD